MEKTKTQAGWAQTGKQRLSNCDHYRWLTLKANELYCSPCSQFSTDSGTWTSSGLGSLNTLSKAANKQQCSAWHLVAVVTLKTFGDTQVDLQLDEHQRRKLSVHSEKLTKMREILMWLIDCVVLLRQQEFPFIGRSEDTKALIPSVKELFGATFFVVRVWCRPVLSFGNSCCFTSGKI